MHGMESQRRSQFIPSEKTLFRVYKRRVPGINGLKEKLSFLVIIMDGRWNFYRSWMHLYDKEALSTRYPGNNA